MKSPLVLLTAMALILMACQSEPKVDTPKEVLDKFSQLYPTASDVTWEQEDSLYEAAFFTDTIEKSVAFYADGTVRVMETSLSVDLLPQAVKDYIAQQAGGQPITGANMIIFADGITQYEAEVGDKDYLFDATGAFLAMETEESPGENNGK
jgi:hypothetical protein